jgi:hypothetical protein
MFKKTKILVVVVMALFVFSGTIFLQRCKPKDTESTSLQNSNNEFVSDKSCKSCHANQYNDWLRSHHFMAMQPPNDSTVLGNFDNSSFTADGVTSKFFKREGNFLSIHKVMMETIMIMK